MGMKGDLSDSESDGFRNCWPLSSAEKPTKNTTFQHNNNNGLLRCDCGVRLKTPHRARTRPDGENCWKLQNSLVCGLKHYTAHNNWQSSRTTVQKWRESPSKCRLVQTAAVWMLLSHAEEREAAPWREIIDSYLMLSALKWTSRFLGSCFGEISASSR